MINVIVGGSLLLPSVFYIIATYKNIDILLFLTGSMAILLGLLTFAGINQSYPLIFIMVGMFALLRVFLNWEKVDFGFSKTSFANLAKYFAFGILFVLFNRFIEKLLQAPSQAYQVGFSKLLVFMLLPVITEELVFRGILLSELSRITNNFTVSLIITSFFFAFSHFSTIALEFQNNAHVGFFYAISLFAGGVFLGLIRKKDSIFSAMAFHFAYNFF